MKKLLLSISAAALMLTSGAAYSESVGSAEFRMEGQADVGPMCSFQVVNNGEMTYDVASRRWNPSIPASIMVITRDLAELQIVDTATIYRDNDVVADLPNWTDFAPTQWNLPYGDINTTPITSNLTPMGYSLYNLVGTETIDLNVASIIEVSESFAPEANVTYYTKVTATCLM